jgi:hypothetical protein
VAKFKPGDVVTIAGQEWTIATWPARDRGLFTYYRDSGGTRTWGTAACGTVSQTIVNADGEVVSNRSEPVTEAIEPAFVREGTLEDHQDLREIEDEQ